MAETTNKQILKPFYTEYASDPTGWTSPINGNWDIIDSAFGGTHPVTLSSSNVTLTDADCQNLKIQLSGSIGTSNLTVFFPTGISGLFVVENLTSGTGTVSLASAGGGGLPRTAVRGANTLIWLDAATNSVTLADNSPVEGGVGITVAGTSIDLDVPVTVPNGGTGQISYSPGQLLIGNNAGGLSRAVLTEGPNIGIVNGNGTITISATGTVAGVNTFSAGSTGLTPNTASAGAVLLSGVLNASSGGTGASTLTGYVKGTGVGVMTASATVPGSDVSLSSGRLLGRYSSGTGGGEEVAIGSGLSLSAGTLSSTAGVISVSASSSAGGFGLASSGGTTPAISFSVSNAGTARGTLGLGDMSTQAPSAVAITGGSAVNLSAARVGTATALTTAERVSVFAPSSTNGVVSKVTKNTNYNFVGASSSGTVYFAVDGIGTVIAGDTAAFTGAQARFTRSNEWALEAYNSAAGVAGNGAAAICVNNAGNVLIGFYYNGTLGAGAPQVGSVTTNGSAVTYGTASDYRLKENIVDLPDSVGIVKSLRPVNFNWKNNASLGAVNGFIAHEVQALVPQAVVGEKDAVNADGLIRPQTIDHSMLVPVLTATIKELIARVEALEAR
jgi:hypothetical protein